MKSCIRCVALVLCLLQPGNFLGAQDPPPPAKTVQEAWTRFEKAWTPYPDMRPLGDPVWKFQYEALVLSMRFGKESAPVPEHAAVTQFAKRVRNLLRDTSPEATATRRALAEFDLANLDSAQLGAPAPDFELTDLAGKAWQLSRLRGKKNVALIFLGYAG